jgi:CopG family nickel-responsive transcriptional regulator
MQRITITLDDDLVEQFEDLRRRQGYGNRSEAFRDLIRDRLAAEQLEQPGEGHCLATLTYVYDHHERDLASRMTRAQHEHHDLTVSTLHVHLDHDNCMETVVLRGPMERVRGFANAVTAQPGVRHAKLQILPVAVREQTHGHGSDDESPRHLHLEPLT